MKRQKIILSSLLILNLLATGFLASAITIEYAYYHEDQFFDMMMVENQYISDLLQYEDNFKIDGEDVYIRPDLTKSSTAPNYNKISTNFIILDNEGRLMGEQTPEYDLTFDDKLLKEIVANEGGYIAREEDPLFVGKSAFTTNVDGEDTELMVVSFFSGGALGDTIQGSTGRLVSIGFMILAFIQISTFAVAYFIISKK